MQELTDDYQLKNMLVMPFRLNMHIKNKWTCCFFFFKQKTACDIYQCDWSSDVCSSDLSRGRRRRHIIIPSAQRRLTCKPILLSQYYRSDRVSRGE